MTPEELAVLLNSGASTQDIINAQLSLLGNVSFGAAPSTGIEYQTVVQGSNLDEFKKATPLVKDIPRGAKMRIQFTLSREELASTAMGDPGNELIFNSSYWWTRFQSQIAGDQMSLESVYMNGWTVVAEGTAVGFPIVWVVLIIVAIISGAGVLITNINAVQDINVSADRVKIATQAAQESAAVATEVTTLAGQGYTPSQIQDVLGTQANVAGGVAASLDAAVQGSPSWFDTLMSGAGKVVLIGLVAFIGYKFYQSSQSKSKGKAK